MSQPGGLGVTTGPSAKKQAKRPWKQRYNQSGAATKKSSRARRQRRVCPACPGIQPESPSVVVEGRASGSWQAVFHTHQLHGALICDRFLLGECTAGSQCLQHHTPLPYHWQLRVRLSQTWVSLGPKAQEHLERNYCNMNTDDVTFEDRDDGSFSQMDLTKLSFDHGKYDQARRLCNSSDPSVSPFFPAEWRVCWGQKGNWEDYKEPHCQQLNAAFERGAWNHAFTYSNRIYNVDLKTFIQRNIKTGFTRAVRRRPIYRYYQSMVPYLKTVSVGDPCTPHRLQTKKGLYPPTWVMHPWDQDVAFLKVPVARADSDYSMVETHFHKTNPEIRMMVFDIYRIQNKFLWQKYKCQKDLMSRGLNNDKKSSLEKELFHGTSEGNVDPICQLNFDPRIAGAHGTAFGIGSYFALEASYSHKFTEPTEMGYRHMFLAKVLVGKMALGQASYRRPPPLEASGALYDSCVDSLLNPKVFVIFDSCQCYPFFLIRYKMLSERIIVTE